MIALGLTLLRSRMKESERWEAAQKEGVTKLPVSTLFQPKYLASILGLVGMYGFWNLWAGTNGFFFPYILRTVGAATQAQSVAIQALSFAIGMASIGLIFMRYADKVNQRMLFAISAIIQVIGMALLAIFPLTIPIALLHVFLLQFGGGFGARASSSCGVRRCSRRRSVPPRKACALPSFASALAYSAFSFRC